MDGQCGVHCCAREEEKIHSECSDLSLDSCPLIKSKS